MSSGKPQTTHFGYRDVPVEDKEGLVRQVFTSVADNYDLMNDLMSMGVHRLWKQHFAWTALARPGDAVLDLAGGTGDIAQRLYKRVGPKGRIVLADINAAMLQVGRDRLLDQGMHRNVEAVQVNAESLPFTNNTFDLVTMAFGLRNVTDKSAALESIHRVLRPGGRALILEFSKVQLKALLPAYDLYSFSVLPRLGQWVADDAQSYRYLAESIRQHPDQDTLRKMMEQAGFAHCQFRNLSAGICALHSGAKI